MIIDMRTSMLEPDMRGHCWIRPIVEQRTHVALGRPSLSSEVKFAERPR